MKKQNLGLNFRQSLKFLVMILFAGQSLSIQARNYFGEKFQLRQPDGTSVSVLVFGNDYYQDVESTDGYTLIRDEQTRKICYAMLSSDSLEYASSGIVYNGEEAAPTAVKMIVKPGIRIKAESIKQKVKESSLYQKQSQIPQVSLRTARALPDTVIGLTVLIDFQDVKSSVSKEQIENFCNGDNYNEFGNYQSIKKYFQWISGGKLTYINRVIGFYTLPNIKSYYDTGDDYNTTEFMAFVSQNIKSQNQVDIDELTSLDNHVMAVNILYAGTADAGWACGLWPHASAYQFGFDGYSSDAWHSYQMTCLGDELTLGTFVHENGHMVCGWPDFYSYDGHQDNNNSYLATDIGGGDSKNPGIPNPWSMDQLGWLSNKQDISLITDGQTVSLKHGVGNVAVFYGTYINASPNERYYLEVRRKTDQHEEPYEGIFIWHSNEDGDNTTEGKPERLDCRPATLFDPCFRQGNGEIFSDITAPSAVWYNNRKSGIYLWDFSPVDSVMTFRCGKKMENPLLAIKNMKNGFLDIAYSDTLFAIGGTPGYQYSFLSGDLPEGLSLTESGILCGVPADTGTFVFRVGIADAEGLTGSSELTLFVSSTSPYTNLNIPGTVELEYFDNGGANRSFYDKTSGNSGNLFRVDSDIDIYQKNDGTYGIGWVDEGEWMLYTVNIEKTGLYEVSVFHAGYKDCISQILIDGNIKCSIRIPYVGYYQGGGDYVETKSELYLPAGKHKLRFFVGSCTYTDFDRLEFSLKEECEEQTFDYYTFVAKHSGSSIHVNSYGTSNGDNILQWTNNWTSNSQWSLVPADSVSYYIVNKYSGLLLTAEDSTSQTSNVYQWEKTGESNQIWRFERVKDSYYRIINQSNGLSLEVENASTENLANVQLNSYHGTDNQLWSIDGEIWLLSYSDYKGNETFVQDSPLSTIELLPLSAGIYKFTSDVEGTLQVLSVKGNIVKQMPVHTDVLLDLRDCADGVYLISFEGDKSSRLWKILKRN